MDNNFDTYRVAFEAVVAIGGLMAGLIKPVTDAVKLAFPRLPTGAIPAVAVGSGVVLLLLLTLASGMALTPQLLAQIVLASVVGSLTAVGINRLHDKASAAQERARAASPVKAPSEQAEGGAAGAEGAQPAEAGERGTAVVTG